MLLPASLFTPSFVFTKLPARKILSSFGSHTRFLCLQERVDGPIMSRRPQAAGVQGVCQSPLPRTLPELVVAVAEAAEGVGGAAAPADLTLTGPVNSSLTTLSMP